MADPYSRNLARDRYYQEMEYGQWYDRQMAHDRHYQKWADEVNARDEWARRNPPARGSYEEHMAGLGGWTYGVDPHRAWNYSPRPVEEALYRRDRGDHGYWYPDKEEDEYYGSRWPRRRRRRDRYEYVEPRRSHRRERYEYVYPERQRRQRTYDVLGGSRSGLPARYVLGGEGRRRRSKRIPRFHGKEFQIRRKWQDWPKVYIGNHPERDGIKVKTKWKHWPKVVVV